MGRLIALALFVSLGAQAQPSCIQFARTVEAVDALPPERRAELLAAAEKQDRRDERMWIVVRAINYLNAGGTKRGAWRQCESL